MTKTPLSPARRLVESYDSGFRSGLALDPAMADDAATLAALAESLPDTPRRLLDVCALVTPAGEALPERLRPAIERDGLALWQSALLLPRASVTGGSDIHPTRYAGACRLNPALRGWSPFAAPTPDLAPTPSFPASDARWDAVVLAAMLEVAPAQLTVDGGLRKDVERRLIQQLGGEPGRWSLALDVARRAALVRAAEGRLRGWPEAPPRPISDPTSLFHGVQTAIVAVLLRVLPAAEWMDVPALIGLLARRCRQIFYSPIDGRYPDRTDMRFDDAGWLAVEAPMIHAVVDVLHRVGFLDVSRDAEGHLAAARRAGQRPAFEHGFLLLPDGDVLVHSGDLDSASYGRLCRLAPYVDGERVHRHRISRAGVAADLAANHRDPVGFLRAHSRTGVPPGIVESIADWSRSATRISVVTGVDVAEDDDGTLRVLPLGAELPADARVVDYLRPPRARFLARRGQLVIPDGSDALTVRAAVTRVARYAGRDGEERIYEPELRAHADPDELLHRLREFYGGELPGELEVLVLAGARLPPIEVRPMFLVRLPTVAAAALRRDRIAGPLLRRGVADDEVVLDATELADLRSRATELGLDWRSAD